MGVFRRFINQFSRVGLDFGLTLLLRHFFAYPFQCLGCHILHPDQKRYGQPRVGQLFGAVHGPETVGQVVVFDTAVRADKVVATVVVGQEKSLVGDHLSGTSRAKKQNGILEGGLVDAVNLLCRDLAPFGLHLFDAGLEQGRNPHAFISYCGCTLQAECGQDQ